MEPFQELLGIIDRLLGPNGCPWDREQTMNSIRSNVIEESSELIDAIDLDDNNHIREELGDLLFVVAFMCKLAEKEKRCNIQEVLQEINAKLIRRHPHVFGDSTVQDSAAVIKQWESIKKQEKQNKAHRKSVLDSIPKGLPALARAQKVLNKLKAAEFPLPAAQAAPVVDEDTLAQALLSIVMHAQQQGLDAEHALRKSLASLETTFRQFERT